MKKIILGLLLAVLLVSSSMLTYAEEFQGESGWTVSFDGKKLNSNFSSSSFADAASTLQPGDSITFTVNLSNGYDEAVDWWMSNKVISSFEDNSAANGGAYTYELKYIANGTENVIYSSGSVGGESTVGGQGLHEATGALENYFYLDTQAAGGSGVITLEVALDGETQGNAYQNTLAQLMMNFAVEITGTTPETEETKESDETETETEKKQNTPKKNQTTVKTGDESPLYTMAAIMGVSGAIIFMLAVVLFIKNRKKQEEEA